MNNARKTRQDAAALWGALTLVFAAAILLPLPGADGRIAHLPDVCVFYRLTGLPCPGCGLTRAFVCLEHGHWAESLHWHPLGGLVFGIFVLLWLRAGLTWLHGAPIWSIAPRWATRWGWMAVTLLLGFGIARIGWLTAHHLRF